MKAFRSAIDCFINSPVKDKISVTVMVFGSNCKIIQENVKPDKVQLPPYSGGGTSYTPVF